MFFPSRPASSARCAHLRQLHGVSDQSLLGDRDVRNGLEHFDERVDTWAATSKHLNFADRSVFRPGSIVGLMGFGAGLTWATAIWHWQG